MTDATRSDYIAGLRKLADVLEQHEEVPLPYAGSMAPITMQFLFGDAKADMAAAARAMPCALHKKASADGNYFHLAGALDGLKIQMTAFRAAVCERVVVGTETVTKTVKDPDALAAVPEVEVTEEVEIVEWQCKSLLAEDSPAVQS